MDVQFHADFSMLKNVHKPVSHCAHVLYVCTAHLYYENDQNQLSKYELASNFTSWLRVASSVDPTCSEAASAT